MDWLEICISTDEEAAEAVAEYLSPFAHDNSVVFEQLGDPDNPDPNQLLPSVNVKIYISADEYLPETERKIEEIIFHLGQIYPIPKPTFRRLADEDWAHAWRKHFKPFRIGQRLWIKPSWIEAAHDDTDAFTITIDPGMAFGTGLHPSTRLCLETIERRVKPGDAVLDVGTGSGILAITAAKLGAQFVVAFDTDSVSTKTAYQNAVLNGVSSEIAIFQGQLDAVRPHRWNLVVVNILAPVITSLLESSNLLENVDEDGQIILSGIIHDQADEVERTITRVGGQINQRLSYGDWIALVIENAPGNNDLPGADNLN